MSIGTTDEVLITLYVNKIYDIWKRFGSILILADFDDTICPYNTSPYWLCNKVVDVLKEARRNGAKVMLYTCRTGHELHAAVNYCEYTLGLHLDGVNPESTDILKNCSNKPFCNLLLDDRAGLPYSLEVLQRALEKYKNYVKSNEEQRSQS